MPAYRIVFVCLGNICRSPMAETIMRELVESAGLDEQVELSSAGTGDWHVGEPADPRTVEALTRRGYDASQHRARQFTKDWFDQHDLVVAMDRANVAALESMAPPGHQHKVRLLTSFDPAAAGAADVPDPYYAGADGFDVALTMIDRACRGLLEHVREQLLG